MYSDRKRNYSVAALCFMIQAVGVGTYVSYGVFFDSFGDEFGWPRALIAGASSLALFLSGLFAILVGRLNDAYGPKLLLSIAAILMGSGCFLMSQVTEVWQLYCYFGVIFGIGLSVVDVIALTTTARWFSHSRGMMTGIVKVGTGAGQFTIPFLASILIAAYGWRAAYMVIGCTVPVILFYIGQKLKRDPGEASFSSRREIVPSNEKEDDEKSDFSVAQALRKPQMWLIFGANFLVVYCLIIVLVHIVPHAGDLGLSRPMAAGVLSTIGAVSMVGRFFSGMAIDRTGSKVIMVICFVILLVSIFWLQIADSLWMLYLFASVYGLAHGGIFTAISPLVAEVFGIASHGAIFGLVVFSGTAGGAVGPIVAGQIFDMTSSYSLVFKMIIVMSFAGLVLILLLKPMKKIQQINAYKEV